MADLLNDLSYVWFLGAILLLACAGIIKVVARAIA